MLIRDCATFKELNKGLKQRDCLSKIIEFLNNDECYSGKVLVIAGLRRTGKTTLLEQAVCQAEINEKDCAFIEAQEGDEEKGSPADTMKDIDLAIKDAKDHGKQIVVIDEITKVSDFLSKASSMPDVFAKEGIRIVLTGTDSLGLLFAQEKELLNRVSDVIGTTYIPFDEHCRVLGIKNMDDYIEHGGLMRKGMKKVEVTDIASAKRFLDSAVADNIAHSLDANKDIDKHNGLKALSQMQMRSIIEKIVEKYSGKINVNVVQNQLDNVTVNWATSKLVGLVDERLVDQLIIDRDDISQEFAKIINADTAINVHVTPEMIDELKRYLKDMQVLSTNEIRPFRKDETGWHCLKPEYSCYIVQPAIKYHHLVAATQYIENNPRFIGLPEKAKEMLKTALDQKIKGDMTEEIVLFDTKHSLNPSRYRVCKPVFKIMKESKLFQHEYDMLVYDKQEDKYYGFEIKHTDMPYMGFDEHGKYNGQDYVLIDEDIKEIVDKQFGKRENVCVLYNGSPFAAPNGTEYYNIGAFLNAVATYQDMDKAMSALKQELTKNIEESKNDTPEAIVNIVKSNTEQAKEKIINSKLTSFEQPQNNNHAQNKGDR